MIIRLLSLVLLAWMLGFAWFAIALPTPLAERETDAVVVLTGGPNRINRGIEVLDRKWAPRMLISGVDLEVRPEEIAAEYKVSQKQMDCCIELGFRAFDTRSNARETARWIEKEKIGSIRLVTSNWHMRRARNELAGALPANVTVEVDAVRDNPSFGMLFAEYHKYLISVATRYIGI